MGLYCPELNIIKLHLTPGSAISEAEIADRLAVSRTPIREAFIRLVEDGLLETYPQKGSIISLIDIEQAEEMRFVRKIIEKAILKEPANNLTNVASSISQPIWRCRNFAKNKIITNACSS